MDPTCEKLNENQRQEMMFVNKDNTVGLIVKNNFAPKSDLLAKQPFDFAERTSLQSTWDAFEAVLQFAGASYSRDINDKRIVEETRKGIYTNEGSHGSTNGMIDRPEDVGGWPEYNSKTALADADLDGMPDEWEIANGLNPNDASDSKNYNLNANYTNLEIYLNSLVEHLFP